MTFPGFQDPYEPWMRCRFTLTHYPDFNPTSLYSYSLMLHDLDKKNKLLASQAPPRVCFYCRIDRFYMGEKKIVSVSSHFRVRSVSLLITIIVSKAFMSKACMVVSGISCHCIWTNTDYYKNKKKVHPCLIKIFGNWPEKLIISFAWP